MKTGMSLLCKNHKACVQETQDKTRQNANNSRAKWKSSFACVNRHRNTQHRNKNVGADNTFQTKSAN